MATIYPNAYPPAFEDKELLFLNPQKILSDSKKEGYPLDIEKIIKAHKIEICKEDMDYDISGYIEKRETKWVIGINKYHSLQRQRFTLAHEFAHYVLHRYRIINERHEDSSLFRTNKVDPIETEANDFAGELLIPKDKFKEYLEKGINKIGDLADKFNVSVSAIRYKAYKLGYLNRV